MAGARPVAAEFGAEGAPHAPWRDVWSKFRRHRLAVAGLATLTLFAAAIAFGPMLLPHDPNRIDFALRDRPPTLTHPMGTDELGRDQLTRVLHGGRISFSVGVSVMLVSMTVGILIGAVTGYFGGAIDAALMRLVDLFYAVPNLFMLIMIVTLAGANYWTIVLGLGFLNWMNTARLVRGAFLSIKEQEFVAAARMLGASHARIVARHILPMALSPVIVSATLSIAHAIMAESLLSFLGLGFQPPNATWGRMLQEAQAVVVHQGHWWRGLFPGLMIFLTVLSVNYVGDGLRDALDPRQQTH